MSKKSKDFNSNKVKNDKVSADELFQDKASLEKLVKDLEQDVCRLKLEKDILQEAAKVIKKDQDINFSSLTNR